MKSYSFLTWFLAFVGVASIILTALKHFRITLSGLLIEEEDEEGDEEYLDEDEGDEEDEEDNECYDEVDEDTEGLNDPNITIEGNDSTVAMYNNRRPIQV